MTFPLELQLTGSPAWLRCVRCRKWLSMIDVIFEDTVDIYLARQGGTRTHSKYPISCRLAPLSQLVPNTTGLGEVFQYF